MSTTDEALKLALDALESMQIVDFSVENLVGWNKAINAIRKARSAPVPLTDGVVQKIISKLEPLLDAKNQSWAEAERMLHGITKGEA